jgi:hypothetical protein
MSTWPDLPIQLTFSPTAWTQSLSTERGKSLRLTAKLKYRYRFVIFDLGDISDTPIEIYFVRGPHKWEVPNMPEDCVGFISYHGDDQSMSAGCSLSEDVFDDLWTRLSGKGDASAQVHLGTVPLSTDANHDIVWNRQQDRFLFIKEMEFVFVRTEGT